MIGSEHVDNVDIIPQCLLILERAQWRFHFALRLSDLFDIILTEKQMMRTNFASDFPSLRNGSKLEGDQERKFVHRDDAKWNPYSRFRFANDRYLLFSGHMTNMNRSIVQRRDHNYRSDGLSFGVNANRHFLGPIFAMLRQTIWSLNRGHLLATEKKNKRRITFIQ